MRLQIQPAVVIAFVVAGLLLGILSAIFDWGDRTVFIVGGLSLVALVVVAIRTRR
jgi:hypothetical protein